VARISGVSQQHSASILILTTYTTQKRFIYQMTQKNKTNLFPESFLDYGLTGQHENWSCLPMREAICTNKTILHTI
jgi:hypothetical protein